MRWFLINITIMMHMVDALTSQVRRVAVIGAGAAGLAFGSVSKTFQGFEVVDIFEASSNVGGVWDYQNGVNNVMYSGLVTNLPKVIMQYSEKDAFLGSSTSSSFATHKEVQSYLENYCIKHHLSEMISFNTRVTKVRKSEGGAGWTVEAEGGGVTRTASYDAVVVCNGHYAIPSVPLVEGADRYTGVTMHSVEYDSAMSDSEMFRDKRVLIVGARASATDIARELACTAKRVIVSDRGLNKKIGAHQGGGDGCTEVGTSHGVLSHRAGLSHFTGGLGISLADGTEKEVDVVMWCTGYDYNFEFLPEELLSSKDRAVRPLYQHVFHRDDPSIAFVGLPHSVVPFPLFRLQSIWISSIFSGMSVLPSRNDRAAWLRSFEAGLDDIRKYHYLGDAQWDYCKWLAEQVGMLDDDLENYLETNRAIYENNKGAMPDYPGGDDAYRRRVFLVDRQKRRNFEVR